MVSRQTQGVVVPESGHRGRSKFVWRTTGIAVTAVTLAVAATPASVAGPLSVLGQMAAAARDPVTIGSIVAGALGCAVLVPLVRDRQSAGPRVNVIEAVRTRTQLGALKQLVSESKFLAGVVAASVCFIFGIATFTVRFVTAHQPVVLRGQFQHRLDAVKETAPQTDQSQQQWPLAPIIQEARLRGQSLRHFLVQNKAHLSEEDLARGWLLAGTQFAILGDTLETNEAIANLAALAARFDAHKAYLNTFVQQIRTSRGASLPGVPVQPPDQRLSELQAIERDFDQNRLPAVFARGIEYVRHYAQDENDWEHIERVLFFGNALMFSAGAIDPSTAEARTQIKQLVTRALLIAQQGKQVLGLTAPTLGDFERLEAQCHLSLAEVAESEGDVKNLPVHLDAAAAALEPQVVERGVPGQCEKLEQILDKLIGTYASIGDSAAMSAAEQRRSAVHDACREAQGG